MLQQIDGPASPLFKPLPFQGNSSFQDLAAQQKISADMRRALGFAPSGANVSWGISFEIRDPVLLCDEPVTVPVPPTQADWLAFLHTTDQILTEPGPGGFISPASGEGRLNERAADYVFVYQDGSEIRVPIRRRYEIGAYVFRWGEKCFGAVPSQKPHPIRAHHEQTHPDWGWSQVRNNPNDGHPWITWLWAWKNPRPGQAITAVRFEPASNTALLVLGLSAGSASEQPIRWRTRRKVLLRLPAEVEFQPRLNEIGLLDQIRLDLGQVISALPRTIYPEEAWRTSYNNQLPKISSNEILVEYTAHPDARFYLWDGQEIPAAAVEAGQSGPKLDPIQPATRRVSLRVVEKGSQRPVAVKLHAHGAAGEYLAPIDRHRIVNPLWFEDFSVDFSNQKLHACTYIPGETIIDLPLGKVYFEVSKGFEIRPLRTVLEIGADTGELTLEIERVLPWRERGWVTADTHVHFLSPTTALLEGAAEGVNIINLLASQWGELMTNVGDFDGRTTWGSREAGGEGEWLVRVGTENRQHVLGHISLLGYRGGMILPMTTGGPDESAIGDPVEILMTEWARQCHQQGGVVVLPHYPDPRGEGAASVVAGEVDAVEMTSAGDLYGGIDPYSLADWYHFLNCGYRLAAVGGTDKMSADIAVGIVRTYAHISREEPFTYAAWMEAIRRAETFVTYGPLLDFFVDGRPLGSRISLTASGGTLDLAWQAASATIPMSRVELIVNGEIRESAAVDPWQASGTWSLRAEHSLWAALLVRGHYPDRPEIITAHSSPIFVDLAGSELMAAADGVTILEQIEGSLAFLDSLGTRADDRAYKRMRLVLTAAHRDIHNRLHQMGVFHDHDPLSDHPEHHGRS